MEAMYQRQSELDLRVPEDATVIGVGGVGAWVAIFLAMSGTKNLVLIDPDEVELSNLNRIPVPPYQVGNHKVDALASLIRAMRPDINIVAVRGRWESHNAPYYSGVIFDCTDRFSVQLEISIAHRNRVRVGYDGGFDITVTDAPPPRWGNQEDTNYEVTPTWVVGAAMAGLLAVAKVCKWPSTNLSFNMADLMEGRFGYVRQQEEVVQHVEASVGN